jgi:hypothetical protein
LGGLFGRGQHHSRQALAHQLAATDLPACLLVGEHTLRAYFDGRELLTRLNRHDLHAH